MTSYANSAYSLYAEFRLSKNYYHTVNSSSHSVNDDIAIQWEWSNFDRSQNPKPVTDYDKPLHNS